MSVQRYRWGGYGNVDDTDGAWMKYADHARIVAEMEKAHAAALAGLEQRIVGREAAKRDRPWIDGYAAAERDAAAAPRTLTADERENALNDALTAVRQLPDEDWTNAAGRADARDAITALMATPAREAARYCGWCGVPLVADHSCHLIHDGEATT